MQTNSLESIDSKDLLQQYTNECARLGDTQTIIYELKEKVKLFVKDLETLDKKYNEQMTKCLQLRQEISQRGGK